MNDADLQERMQLAIERISEIKEEDQTIWDTLAKMDAGAKNLKTYFDSVAEFILYVYDVYEIVSQPGKIDLPASFNPKRSAACWLLWNTYEDVR